MPELTVTSEIYGEYDYRSKTTPSTDGNVISEFPFLLPESNCSSRFDEDDDLDVERPKKEVIKIEHSSKTKIALVGLQVWRGAFLLGDMLIHFGLKGELKNKTVLELGAGTGLTSFVAAMFAKKVVCTVDFFSLIHGGDVFCKNRMQCLDMFPTFNELDIDLGGILDLIKLNAKYNAKLIKSHFKVMALDFTAPWSHTLTNEIIGADIVIAADVIYDDDVTAAFVSTIQKILNTNPPKILYVVLEKRYVFTIEHMDSVAPCYETFLTLLDKVKTENINASWTVEQLPLDFPKYFTYDRVKELVLWRIASKPN